MERCLLLNLTAIASQAATITVANKNDSGTGSLRQAIIDANNGDTINFAAGLNGSIQLTSALPIDKTLTINGHGANILGVEGLTTPTESRVFNIFAGNVVRISDLRISRGFSSGAGGGVTVESGGNLTLNNCLISGNSATDGGGVYGSSGSIITITNSTIYGNVADYRGGGVFTGGGTLVLVNSTIFGNEAPVGGVAVISNGSATILNCTITGNSTAGFPFSYIAGFFNVGGLLSDGSSTVNLKNTIIAKNIASGANSYIDVESAVTSQGNNLIGNTTGGSGFVASDLLNVANPQLGGFANNGGATYTVSLLTGSPAINAGNNTGAPATDQRGVARPQGAAVDIGAYESGVRPAAFGKIVFVETVGSSREIFSMNADGSNQVQLTNSAARDDEPRWSPDGSKIVFVRDVPAGLAIYTMNADGTNISLLTTGNLINENPTFSPDGSKIAFGRNGQIFVMNADGSNVVQLTSNSYFGVKAHPSWSPDGTRIVFHNNRGYGDFELKSVAASCVNCTGGQSLAFTLPSDKFDPVWSPDGNTVAFSNDQLDLNDHSQPYTFLVSPYLDNLNFPARDLNAVSSPRMFSPAWSPDGTKFVYQNSGDLFTINTDGTSPTNLGVMGLLPDWFGFNTPTGTNISALSGTVSVTFSNVGTGGTTTAVAIDPATTGNLPGGYSFGAGFPAYEITTTAIYTAPITVCLQVPGVISLAVFNALNLFHDEGGVLVNRTVSRDFATKTICASVTSLSPFAVAQNLAPLAANVSVGGQVIDANGSGISKARVSITNPNGETLTVLTNSFGYYRFDDVVVGETYIISVNSKRFQFANQTQVIFVGEEITDIVFVALP
ncbi:hypothetical protein BH10ACI1_BH10ACI1_23780 [soil metagenome]